MEPSAKQEVIRFIKLLQYPKTKKIAIRCLVLIAHTVEPDWSRLNCPRVEIFKVYIRPEDRDLTPAKHCGRQVHWEKIEIEVMRPRPLEGVRSPITDEHEQDLAELLARAMNALLTVVEQKDGTCVNILERKLANIAHPMKQSSHYKQFRLDSELKNRCKEFKKFACSGGDFKKEMAQILLAAFCSISSKFNPSSPIHQTIRNDDLDALIMLLSNCKDLDIEQRDLKGFTPLQIAVQCEFPLIVKTLILFGADVKTEIRKTCQITSNSIILTLLKQSQRRSRKWRKRRPESLKRHLYRAEYGQTKRTHIVSLDGGGIRGLVLTTILAEIQAAIGGNIMERFTFLAGSSTGAILAVALAQGKTIAECRNIYFRLKDVVFYRESRAVNYSHETLEEFLNDELNGVDPMASLKEDKGKFVIVTSCDTSVHPMKPVLFKSYKMVDGTDDGLHFVEDIDYPASEPDDAFAEESDSCSDVDSVNTAQSKQSEEYDPVTFHEPERVAKRDERRRKEVFDTNTPGNPCHESIRFALRCSSAAPTYFDSPDEVHQDGGVLHNNPSEFVLTEFKTINDAYDSKHASSMRLGIFLSVGTGSVKQREGVKCNPTCGAVYTSSLVKFMRQFIGQVGRSDGPVVGQSIAVAHCMDGLGFRFSPTFEDDIELDETSNEVLIEMMWKTKVYMRNERWKGKLRALAKILKM